MRVQSLDLLQQRLDEATASLEAGFVHDAAAAIRQAVLDAPHSADARLLEARIELARDQPEKALAALDAHDLHHPDGRHLPQVALLRSEALCRTKKHDRLALDLLGKFIADHPDDLRPRRLIARLLERMDRGSEAIVHLSHILTQCPTDHVTRRMLAAQLARINPQQAAEALEESMDQGDSTLSVKLRVARLYHQAGRLHDAEVMYRQLLVFHATDPLLWQEAAELAAESGAMDLALHRLEQAIHVAGRPSVKLLEMLATQLMRSGRIARAGRQWWKLHRLHNSCDVQAGAGLLVCALAQGRKGIVRRAHRALGLHASRDERRQAVMHAWSLAAGGQVIASHLYKPVRAPRAEESHNVLAGLLERSIDKLATHASRHPGRADAHYHLANCHAAADQQQQALAAVERALDINPSYALASKLYAQLHVRRRQAA